jgi:glycolate oxidase iron-sulfur subunit
MVTTGAKADNQLLQKAQMTVSQCDRCGACLPVCPLFGARDVETASARGKNALARALAEGGVEPTPDVLAVVNFCLLCQACVEACPNRIRTDEAMINLRQFLMNRPGGKNAKYRALGGILKNRSLVTLAAGTLALLRRLDLNNLLPYGVVPEEYTRAQFLAAFAGPAALGWQAPPSGVAVTAATKVAYFQGCGMRMMFPAASAETRKILQTTTPLIMKANVCCGLPHLAHGMRNEFLTLAKENIRLYEDVDVVVSDCASCSGTFKHIGSYFDDDPDWQERAAAFSRKAMDLTEYLDGVGYRPRQQVDVTFTYHDPCHLVRGQGIRKQPRNLLQAAGIFVEMDAADTCCGGAGSFHADYPGIAASILAKKQQNIEATGAGIVVTACPGCLIQLTKAAQNSGNKFKAMHISQVI